MCNEPHNRAMLRTWVRRLPHPFTAAERAAHLRHELSILQAEFALTQVFDRPVQGRVFFEEVTTRAVFASGGWLNAPPPTNRSHRYRVTEAGQRVCASVFLRTGNARGAVGAAVLPRRIRLASSRNVTSNRQCSSFSMLPCERTAW